ncbi:hypothetical protein N7478_009543 [Penicillium angulare]|uniref:uncharacterized protein n=1 Tax=Penicillium angulare TaxID=116970 RepID=UPI002541ED0D|nr:uncharacterized protein N7478_009543 [Penicillium angulare]KAJ5266735.1 hypothetical protein N7478_009543 [Penicillium angulare]
MSNLMHKVKDAITGHHESGNKGSTQESSNATSRMDEARDTYNSSDNTGMNKSSNAQVHDAGHDKSKLMDTEPYKDARDTYDSSNMGTVNYGSTGYGANKMDNTANAYGSSNLGNDTFNSANTGMSTNKTQGYDNSHSTSKPIVSDAYGAKNLNSEPTHGALGDSSNYKQSNVGSRNYGANTHSGNYGASTAADSYGTTSGGYGSGNLNTSGRETQATKQMDKGMGNRGAYGDSMDQSKKYTSDYGSMGDVQPGGTHDYNTRANNTGSNMANQMENRGSSELNQQTGQQGFGGAAAGGSSYNSTSSGRRRSSGPHNSNLLNKLDPRVRSSDYENKAMSDQRGN